jgi:hypothetical protein
VPITETPRLAGDQAHASRRGVPQDRHAGLDAKGAPDQVLDWHALQHHRGGGLVVDLVRQPHEQRRGQQARLGVGARWRRGVGHAVARRDL